MVDTRDRSGRWIDGDGSWHVIDRVPKVRRGKATRIIRIRGDKGRASTGLAPVGSARELSRPVGRGLRRSERRRDRTAEAREREEGDVLVWTLFNRPR